EKREVVLKVLEEIGAGNHPMLTVYNKIDLVSDLRPEVRSELRPSPSPEALPCRARAARPLLEGEGKRPACDEILVSAATGEGLPGLVEKISQEVSPVRA